MISRTSSPTSARGFTLLELIVAAGILALIAVFSWRALDALVREREALAASQATIDLYQRAFARLERDALLASDVELDGDGAVRLVAGGGALDGGSGDTPTVEYRFRDGALLRTVPGVDRASLTLVDGMASVAVEAWTPTPRGGGAWVRTKAAAPQSVVAAVAPTAPASASPTSALPGTALPAAQAPGAPPTPAPDASKPAPASATGLRITFATTSGGQVTRTFIIGGA